MAEAWVMCDTVADQREENRQSPNVPVSYEELAEIGVSCHTMNNVDTMLDEGPDGEKCEVDKLMERKGYKNRDQVICSPDKLENYDAKLKMFFEEHIHEDEEIRLIKDGSGYFDVRGKNDEWIRILVKPGNLLVVPAGIYHRFTMDTNNYTHAIRLFYDAPKWTPVNRPCEDNEYRKQYLEKYIINPAKPKTLLGEANTTDNISLTFPWKFDETVKSIIPRLDAAKKDLLIMWFTGKIDEKTGKSWCPDCVTIREPLIEAIAKAQKTRRVSFLQVDIVRSSYLRNPDFVLRKHPFVELNSIPTVIVCEAKEEGPEGSEDSAAGLNVLAKFENFNDSWLAKL